MPLYTPLLLPLTVTAKHKVDDSIPVRILRSIAGKVEFLFHHYGTQSLKDSFRYGTWEIGRQDKGVVFGDFGIWSLTASFSNLALL